MKSLLEMSQKYDRFDHEWKILWTRRRGASAEEAWKWDYQTWRAVLEKIFVGKIENLKCPICGENDVYFRYMVIYKNKKTGLYSAERYVGCESQMVQFHDRAKVPQWLNEIEWEPSVEGREI